MSIITRPLKTLGSCMRKPQNPTHECGHAQTKTSGSGSKVWITTAPNMRGDEPPSQQQLRFALGFALKPFWDMPIGYKLLEAFKHPTGYGSHPGWSLTFFRQNGFLHVEVWTLEDISGFDRPATCTWDEFLQESELVLNQIVKASPDQRGPAAALLADLKSGVLAPVGI